VDQVEGGAMTRPALIVLAALLAGCSAAPPKPAVIETKVQVSVPCDPGPVPAPAFPVDGLTGDEDIYTKAQTMAADIETREGYEARLKAAVDSCRP
jgi:hypothetical protein